MSARDSIKSGAVLPSLTAMPFPCCPAGMDRWVTLSETSAAGANDSNRSDAILSFSNSGAALSIDADYENPAGWVRYPGERRPPACVAVSLSTQACNKQVAASGIGR